MNYIDSDSCSEFILHIYIESEQLFRIKLRLKQILSFLETIFQWFYMFSLLCDLHISSAYLVPWILACAKFQNLLINFKLEKL